MREAATICPRPLQALTCRPSGSEDMADLRSCGLVTLTFDLLTLELAQNVTCGTDNLPANFSNVTILTVDL